MGRGLGISAGLMDEVLTLKEVDEFLVIPESEIKVKSLLMALRRWRMGHFVSHGYVYPEGWELRTMYIPEERGVPAKIYVVRVR